MEGDQQKKKTTFVRPSPVGVEEWPSQCPEAIVSQTLVFLVFLVTFHGFLLVLAPSCMVLFVFLVTFHVFLLIVEAGGRAAWLAGHAVLAVWLVALPSCPLVRPVQPASSQPEWNHAPLLHLSLELAKTHGR